jgi:hypothetical protein
MSGFGEGGENTTQPKSIKVTYRTVICFTVNLKMLLIMVFYFRIFAKVNGVQTLKV